MADKRVSGNTVFSGPTGEVVLDLTDSAQGPLLNAGKISAYPLVIGTDVPHDAFANLTDKGTGEIATNDIAVSAVTQAKMSGPPASLSAYPLVLGTDVPHDTAAGVGAVAAGTGVVSMFAGTAASRPAAGTADRLYFATDTGEFSYDTGSAWVKLNQLAGALTINGILKLQSSPVPILINANANGATSFTNNNHFLTSNIDIGQAELDLVSYSYTSTGVGSCLQVRTLEGSSSPYTISAILFGVGRDGHINTKNNTLDDGSGNLSANTLASTVATGTAPLSVASTTEVANLNSERWGGAKNDITLIKSTGNYSTPSASLVSTGEGGPFVPTSSKVIIIGSANVYNNTVGEDALIAIYRNTTGIPAAGTTVSDTPVAVAQATSAVANADITVPLIGLDTGLTPGTTYYYYWALAASLSGTATMAYNSLSGGPNETQMTLRST